MQATDAVFYIIIVIMSVVVHEVSHGFVAEFFGDNTARDAGRLTLNPLKHLDLFGSIILPIFLYFSTHFVFGWATPVPYNPNNFRNKKWGTVWVAAAGILANFLIAGFFGVLIHAATSFGVAPFDPLVKIPFYTITIAIVQINLALAIFNLVPIPPLDGSKILFSLLPKVFYPIMLFMERFSLILVFAFIMFFSDSLTPIFAYFIHLFTGL